MLEKAFLKYCRQVPVYIFFNWINTQWIPNLSYNAYIHDFPWFGVNWYNKSVMCARAPVRYALLLNDPSRRAALAGSVRTEYSEVAGVELSSRSFLEGILEASLDLFVLLQGAEFQ